MGCRHSSKTTESPVKIRPNENSVILTSKISLQRAEQIDYRIYDGFKSIKSKSSVSLKKSRQSLNSSISNPQLLTNSTLEQTLDGRGKNLIKRFEFDSPCLVLDVSPSHTLIVDDRQLRLIHMETMMLKTVPLPLDCLDIHDIAWSTQLDAFLLLTGEQMYRVTNENLQPTPIHQIQFILEGPRKSYMAVDGDDLLINRSFGSDLRRYSLSTLTFLPSPPIYLENEHICVTTIQLNSNKILALAISIGKRQMIDLVNFKTNQLLHRISLDINENLLYPIDLHNHGQWFAKICIPCQNIGHCLISSDGQLTRLKLFPNQDNFIRSLRMTLDNRWLLVARQHALEIYQPYTSLLPLVKDLVGFSSSSLK